MITVRSNYTAAMFEFSVMLGCSRVLKKMVKQLLLVQNVFSPLDNHVQFTLVLKEHTY